ncbi:hypothetical protein ACH5RR_026268 [Cinchona calisaya]|uniref:Uncharacterized protein n=1 Tax=Cinchona calisaya TaxID=153742 RepID=A0ABD2Z405_9GENT
MAYNCYHHGPITPPVVQHQAYQANASSGALNLNMQDALLAQQSMFMNVINNMEKAMENLGKPSSVNAMTSFPTQPSMTCDFCGGGHANGNCQMPYGTNEQINYVANQSSFPRNQFGAYGEQLQSFLEESPKFLME